MAYTLKGYYAVIKEWERIYGGKSRALNYDLTEARLCCVKCGKLKSKMSRHHIENDFMFAQMLPDIYAKRYIEFRKEDTAKLCDDCHKNIHRYYKAITHLLWYELSEGGQRIITREWCEKWRAEFRMMFEKWIKKPVKKRKRKRKKRFTN